MDENNLQHTNPEQQDDDFIIGKGFTVAPVNTGSKHAKKANHHAVLRNTIWIISIIVVAVGLGFGMLFVGADYLGIGFGRGDEVVMEIAPGSPAKMIADKLNEVGVVKCPLVFRVYSKLKHYDAKYKYGVYTFDSEAGYESLAQMLMTEGAVAESVTVTVPEMASVDDIAVLLEENGVCTKSDFINEVQHGEFDYEFVKSIPKETVYYRLEGYLFPDTYDFYSYDSAECAHLAVDKMLKTLEEKINQAKLSVDKIGDYSFHEIMTMASIVELEAGGSAKEMSNVAAVFFNRLKSPDFATLGSSPTRKYPHGNGRYNTYEAKGLPPGPLCSPSFSAIQASVNPTKNFDFFYFVTDKSMKFYYRKTLKEHNAIIAKLQAENNWIYEE